MCIKKNNMILGDKGEVEKQGVSEFQAKFLEFSQKKQGQNEEAKAAGDANKKQQEASQAQAVKTESVDGSEARTPSAPGTPMTPSMAPGQYTHGAPSPHQAAMYGQPSPSGMPSPKIMPSPKSQPSPRTPGEGQFPQQPSPFSQHSMQSPFSPSATATASAPQSPYAGTNPGTQSPFAVPASQSVPVMKGQGSPLPTSHSPSHTPPAAFPMQRSPRANVPGQPVQYPQGQFQQGYMQGPPPPRGMVPGQTGHPFNQTGVRQQIPGIRPPTSLPLPQQQLLPGQPQVSGDMTSPGMRPMHPGMRLERPGFPGHPPTSPGKPGQGQAGVFPGMPGLRASTPGSQPPQSFMSQNTAHSAGMVAMASAASTVTTSTGQSRSTLLQDQPLLIQDLLEQVQLKSLVS